MKNWIPLILAALASAMFGSRCLAVDKEKPKTKTQRVNLASDLLAEGPAEWKSQEPKGRFRTHEFVLPSSEKGLADGFMMVTHFGKGGGGGLEDNLKRWYLMVEQPDGTPAEKAAKKHEFKSDSAKVTWIEMSGTYLDRPMPASPDVTRRPKYRVFAVMIDGGAEGPYWIRAYGPDSVMQSHRDGFERFLKSITKK